MLQRKMPAQTGTSNIKAITVAHTRTPVIQIAGRTGVDRLDCPTALAEFSLDCRSGIFVLQLAQKN
jgi:hypothetical protein